MLKERVTPGLAGVDGGMDSQLTLHLYEDRTGHRAHGSCNRKEKGKRKLDFNIMK